MKTRVSDLCVKALSDGKPLTTDEIKTYVNKHDKHGTTCHALGNVLSKDSRFKKVDKVSIYRSIGGSKYKVSRWTLNQ